MPSSIKRTRELRRGLSPRTPMFRRAENTSSLITLIPATFSNASLTENTRCWSSSARVSTLIVPGTKLLLFGMDWVTLMRSIFIFSLVSAIAGS